MKKVLFILGSLALTACTVGHELDLDKAAAKRQEHLDEYHRVNGCTLTHDLEGYHDCLLNTQLANSPKTYTPRMLQDGRPIAVVQQASSSSPCGLKALPNKQPEYPWVAPTTTSETKSVETLCQRKFEPRQTVIQTIEQPIPAPQPEVIFVEREAPAPAPVVVATPAPAPAPVQWQPQCPCADPNDPCPQCYEK